VDFGSDWWTPDVAGREEYADVVNRLSLKMAELRGEINKLMTSTDRTPANIQKVLDVMQRVMEVERGFQDWIANLPESFRPRTVAWVESVAPEDLLHSEVYPGKIDVYSDIWVVSVWNLVRVSRLFVSGAIIRCNAWLGAPNDYRTTPEYAAMARLGVDMVNDMVASIPYHLGWTSKEGLNGTNAAFGGSASDGFVCGAFGPDESTRDMPRSLGAYVGVWPLFTVSSSDFTTDLQRIWIKGRLKHIAEHVGINQAGTLSGVGSVRAVQSDLC
jgi:hypothetical protein